MSKNHLLLRIVPLMCMAVSLICTSCQSHSVTDYDVVPQPLKVTLTGNSKPFTLTSSTKICYTDGDSALLTDAELLAGYLKQQTGLNLQVTSTPQSSDAIVLATGLESSNPEAYTMTVTPVLITIDGATAAGTFYGAQTLRKAIGVTDASKIELAAAEISDEPRFGYRGAHLDVARHFFPVDSVKSFIDMIALHNINRFHWHLTDDQGWRIEIKSHPALTEKGSTRSNTVIGHNTDQYDSIPVSGFYTQDELRDVIKYAADRHITIIPEVDLPGHMVAALAAYPELGCTGGPYEVWNRWGISKEVLCAGNPDTYAFLKDVLDEVTDIFPSEYIHIGGDECPKVRWESCPKCQARIKELGIKADPKHTAEQKLQSYVMTEMEQYLKSKGRRVIGWDEILEGGLGPDATVHSWRGIKGGEEAVRQGHDAIMSPNIFMYFDYYQSADTDNEPDAIGGLVTVETVYGFEPVTDEMTPEEAAHIKGVQANLWTEYISTYNGVEYMELPRMAALSEVQWTPRGSRTAYPSFLKKLPRLIDIYKQNGYRYATHVYNVKHDIKADSAARTFTVTLSTLGDAPIFYNVNGTEQKYDGPFTIDSTCTISAQAERNGQRTPATGETLIISKSTFRPVEISATPSKKYTADGPRTLTDGRIGTNNYKSGEWMGFRTPDVTATVDLGEQTPISNLSFNTLIANEKWIFAPSKWEVATSTDGINFTPVDNNATYDSEVVTSKQNADDIKNGIIKYSATFNTVEARYVRLTIVPEPSMPEWHDAAGKRAFVFIDEIEVN